MNLNSNNLTSTKMTELSYSKLLLEQVKLLIQIEEQPKKTTIDYDAIVAATRKALKNEMREMRTDDRVLMTQNEAKKTYGKSVISALVKRGVIEQYKFDTRDAIDKDGEPIKKAKGVIYYRVAEIEKGIEEGNILKGTRAGVL